MPGNILEAQKTEIRDIARLNNWLDEFRERALAFLDKAGSFKSPDDIDGGVGWLKLTFRWDKSGREIVIDLDDDGDFAGRAITTQVFAGEAAVLKALGEWSQAAPVKRLYEDYALAPGAIAAAAIPGSFAAQLTDAVRERAREQDNLDALLGLVLAAAVDADLAHTGVWDRSDDDFQVARDNVFSALTRLGIDVETALEIERREFVAEVEVDSE